MPIKLLATLAATALLALSASPLSGADAVPGQNRCQRLSRAMDRVRSQMRQGYSAREGARLRSRMRDLKTRYYRRCRPTDR